MNKQHLTTYIDIEGVQREMALYLQKHGTNIDDLPRKPTKHEELTILQKLKKEIKELKNFNLLYCFL